MSWLSLGVNFLGHTKNMTISTQSLLRLWFFLLLVSRRLHSLFLNQLEILWPKITDKGIYLQTLLLYTYILPQVVVSIFSGFGCWEGIFEIHTKHVTCSQIKPSSLFYRPENYSGKQMWLAKWKLQLLALPWKWTHWETWQNASVSVCRHSKRLPLFLFTPRFWDKWLCRRRIPFPRFWLFYVMQHHDLCMQTSNHKICACNQHHKIKGTPCSAHGLDLWVAREFLTSSPLKCTGNNFRWILCLGCLKMLYN